MSPTAEPEFHDQVPCPACNGIVWKEKFEILRECNHCGHTRAAGSFGSSDYKHIYNEKYFKGDEYRDYLGEENKFRRHFRRRLQRMQRLIGEYVGPVFDVGCAYGLFLHEMKKCEIEAEGVDLAPEAVAHAVTNLFVKATAQSFTQMEIPPEKFKTFTLWDVIEHLPRPELVIEKITQHIAPRGWIFITTGDMGSTYAQLRGKRWRMIHPPSHLHYFTRESMRKMLERRGFEIVEMRSEPSYQNAYEIFTRLSQSNSAIVRGPAKLGRACIPEFLRERLGLWVSLGDIMWVAARKV